MKKTVAVTKFFIFLPPYVLGNIYLPSVGSFDQCVHSFSVLTKLLPLPPLLWHRNYLFALYNYVSFVETERKETCDCDGNLSSFRRISSVFQNEALLDRVVLSLCLKFEIRLNHIYIRNKQNLEKVMILPEMKQGSPNCPNTTADGMVFCTNHNISVSERYLCIGIP